MEKHNNWLIRKRPRLWMVLLIPLVLGGYWLLPISGQVTIVTDQKSQTTVWPRMYLSPSSPTGGEKAVLQVTDTVPWAHVVVTVDGQPAKFDRWWENTGGSWTWQWTLEPDGRASSSGRVLVFYRDCDTGCVEQGRFSTNDQAHNPQSRNLVEGSSPTKLGVVFANPARDWHGSQGWDVELTYARLAEAPDWGINRLAAHVYDATAKGLRVLVRVDYDRGQSLPPAGDSVALAQYLTYLRRLARDERLSQVYGYVIGSGFNALDANSQAPDRPVTPGWYARLFNGYGEEPSRANNVLQTIRAANPRVRVLVGPVRPWSRSQDGEPRYTVDVPWLNYMNSLVAALDEVARAKARVGVAMAAPDGFAVQAPGRPSAAEMALHDGAEEPRLDLKKEESGQAQVGFRVYQDWQGIVNSYETTRGLPIYITSANTYAPDEGIPPAQNYPRGWLSTALAVINDEPQVLALCWFVDGPLGDSQWEWFSLSQRSGRMIDADEELDSLLQRRR